VIFEDLHWIDGETQAFLDLFADSMGTAKILLLLNYRPEYSHSWNSKTYYSQLRLDPLRQESAAEMLSALLGEGVELGALKRLIVERTDGNPFFMEELVRALFDDASLTRNGAVKITKSLSRLKIPSTVQAILASRIDRLPPAEKDLLQILAIVGREFPLSLIREVTKQSDDDLNRMLNDLQLGEFIYEQPAIGEVEYTFKHALTQEVASNSVLNERRRHLHERTGAAIESLYADRLDDHVNELAHHYERSTNIEKAVEYLSIAGRRASQRAAHLEAINNLSSGLELLMKLPRTPERDRQELALQSALGPSLMETRGDSTPEVAAAYSRVVELGERMGETQQVFWAQGGLFLYYMVRGQTQTAHGIAQHLLDLVQPSDDPAKLLLAHGFMGIILYWGGELALAHSHFEQAAIHVDPPRQRHLASLYGMDLATGYSGYAAWPLWILGYPDQALKRIRRTLSLAQERGHLSSSVMALHHAALGHVLRREPRIAQELVEAGLTLSNEHGFGLWTALLTIQLGHAFAQSGHEAKAIVHMEQGIEAARAAGSNNQRATVGALAEAYGKTGRGAEGLRLIAEAMGTIGDNAEHPHEPELHRIKGELLIMLDASNFAGAEHCFRHAIERAQCHGAKSWELRATTSLSRLIARQDKQDEARTMLADIYNWFTEGFDTADLKDARALLDELGA
jgi:tetratricopeptide (TPR) repeat protein